MAVVRCGARIVGHTGARIHAAPATLDRDRSLRGLPRPDERFEACLMVVATPICRMGQSTWRMDRWGCATRGLDHESVARTVVTALAFPAGGDHQPGSHPADTLWCRLVDVPRRNRPAQSQ